MLHRFSRTELLLGPEGLERLRQARVAVFGIGGVGSYACEALARAGVGSLVLVDYDNVCLTNINRQIHALSNTVGRPKVELMAERIKLINPGAEVESIKEFYAPEHRERLLRPDYDYVVDAIDNVTGKLDLIKGCLALNIPIISAMGAGNKLDPTAFRVADISETAVDPLARVLRRELRKAGIYRGVKVVYSEEPPIPPRVGLADCKTNCVCTSEQGRGSCTLRRQIPGSVSFVPPVVGMIMAGEVVKDLCGLVDKRTKGAYNKKQDTRV
ncbi:MAG: tRNA threonylcarbamoyladenosine dehydratase [Bacillota bacterium]